jgi:hypothetical protein
MKNKLMIGLASTGLVAVTAMGAWSLANNAIISGANATGTSYSAAFTGTAHPLGISPAVMAQNYSGTSASGKKFYYCASISGGSGTVNGTIGSNSNIWAVYTAPSDLAGELTMYFAMNNITKINVGNYYIGSTTATNTVYGSTVGYSSNFHPTSDWSSVGSLSFGYDFGISLSGCQAVKVVIDIPAGSTVGFSATITWAC